MGRKAQARRLAPFSREYDYYPTTGCFHESTAFVRILWGPWRSGKTTACINELMFRAMQQAQAPDGVRHTRFIITRDTYPNLKKTVLLTALQWFPTVYFGDLTKDIPITLTYRFAGPDGIEVESEWIFLALVTEDDISKLLSLECTGAYFCEVQDQPRALLDDMIGRVGQYPPMDWGGPTWEGIIADTNPPHEDHWLVSLSDQITYLSKHGALPPQENQDLGSGFTTNPEVYDQTDALPPDTNLYAVFKQPSGLSPEAENLDHLKGGRAYYERLARNPDPNFVRMYVKGLPGTVRGLRLVYPEFREVLVNGENRIPWHVSPAPLKPEPGVPLYVGWDFGLTPCVLILQMNRFGQLRILREVTSEHMGLRQFIRTVLRWHLQNEYHGYALIGACDPAGKDPVQTDERTCLDIMREEGITWVDPAETNAFLARREAVAFFLTNMDSRGQPLLLIDPHNCPVLIDGFKRGYRYKRAKIQGQERYTDVVDKVGNPHTHPQDCLQYGCMRILLGAQRDKRMADIDHNHADRVRSVVP